MLRLCRETAFLTVTVILLFFPYYAFCGKNHPLSQFVISMNDNPDFGIIKEPAYYGPESLWNYIDGGAVPYLDYGVCDVVTYQGLWGSDSLLIVVDIYDMADSLGAFGIYSNERFPENPTVKIGIEGFYTENTLCFWKDRYYVKVFTHVQSPPSFSPVEKIARSVENLMPEGSGMSHYFSLFPEPYRLEKTESFKARNVLGQDYLEDAFIVNYSKGEEEFQLYVIKDSDAEKASENFCAYREFIREYGTLDANQISIGDEAFTGKDSWYGPFLFVRYDKFNIGCIGLSDSDPARFYINEIISGLSR